MKKRLYLHIGLSKTGTSFIQSSLAASRSELAHCGIMYPQFGKENTDIKYGAVSSGNAVPVAALFLPDKFKFPKNEDVWEQLSAVLTQSEKGVLLSSEFLLPALLPGFSPENLKQLQLFAGNHNAEVVIIIFIRNFLDFSFSIWGQMVKMGNTNLMFDKYLAENNLSTGPVNHLNVIETAVGRQNLKVFNYDRRRENLLLSMEEALGIQNILIKAHFNTVNRSLASDELARMMFVGNLLKNKPEHERKRIAGSISQAFTEADDKKPMKIYSIPSEIWINFNKKMIENVSRINKKWLNAEPLDISLFIPTWGDFKLPEVDASIKSILYGLCTDSIDKRGFEINLDSIKKINETGLYVLASRYFRIIKDYSKALWASDQAVQLAPYNVRVLTEHFKTQGSVEDFAGQTKTLHTLIKLRPDNTIYHVHLAHVFARQNAIDEAIMEMNEAITLDDSNARFYHHLGNFLLRQGAIESSIKAQQQAIELDSTVPAYHAQLAQAFARQNAIDDNTNRNANNLLCLFLRLFQRLITKKR